MDKIEAKKIRQNLKEEIKSLATEIIKTKIEFKESQRNGSTSYKLLRQLNTFRYEYRHKHIVASLLRGKIRDQIESKVRDDNQPDESYIEKLLEQYKPVRDFLLQRSSANEEAVCIDQV